MWIKIYEHHEAQKVTLEVIKSSALVSSFI